MRWPAAISAARMVAANSGVPMKIRSSGVITQDTARLLRCARNDRNRSSLRGAERRSNLVGLAREKLLRRRQRFAALGLRQLPKDHAALQRRDVIDEQHAVEMVHLVLDAGGEEALRLYLADLVLVVEIAQPDRRRPLDLGVMLRQRQAALVRRHQLLGTPQDLGVGDAHRLRRLAVAGAIDD